MKLLSVCIPTYKRPDTLRRCIDSVVSQIQKYRLEEQVQIYVANDASPDETANLLETFRTLSFFSSISREQNRGMSANIKAMLEEASRLSKFQLIITDDDFLQPEIMGIVVSYLNTMLTSNPDVALIWTPRFSYQENGDLHCVVCKVSEGDRLVPPSISAAGRYMFNGFILSGLIVDSRLIGFSFWNEYIENAFFPVIFTGELITRKPSMYWDMNVVHHTVLNQCHWEDWGRSEILINLRLFSDYLNAHRIVASRITKYFGVVLFYLSSSPAIYGVVKSFALSENLKGDKTVFFEAVGAQKNEGHLRFNFPILLSVFASLNVIILIALAKILVTRIQLFMPRNDSLIQHYKNRIKVNLNLVPSSLVMLKMIFSLAFGKK